MKVEIDNITIIYPNEHTGENRNMEIETDGEHLQFHFIDKKNLNSGGMTLDKNQAEILRDSLTLILKNKLIE
ncbi:hypothetical protein [uncultured Aquimarina sp.]|uniref:hypothetical protein n=1 Tax=uncultured Aquimarina sp. TaxID=575652 RepID=UPI002616E108|nr:hypothetical protein [uncultured Aquimarina sp.]